MKFVILDVYPDKKYRLVKDTAGGYGTGNDFGDSFFSKLLNIYVDQSIGMPAIEVMIISSILKQDNEVYYTRNLNDEKILDCDYVIFPSSIIAHETELSTLSKLENCWYSPSLSNNLLSPQISIFPFKDKETIFSEV